MTAPSFASMRSAHSRVDSPDLGTAAFGTDHLPTTTKRHFPLVVTLKTSELSHHLLFALLIGIVCKLYSLEISATGQVNHTRNFLELQATFYSYGRLCFVSLTRSCLYFHGFPVFCPHRNHLILIRQFYLYIYSSYDLKLPEPYLHKT
jgi:hypothetical protein